MTHRKTISGLGMRNLSFLILVLIFVSCKPNKKDDYTKGTQVFDYAKGIVFAKHEGYTLVNVKIPYKGAKEGHTYVLYPRKSKRPGVEADTYIPVPAQSIVCTSTTHIPLLDYLGETDKLVGFPTTDYISSEKMRARIDSGLVVELGIDNALNIERLIQLNPELVMAYTMTGDYGQLDKIQQAGIPVIINAEYMEPDPLGRAEWIKLAGLLFGKEAEADSVFTRIADNYNKTRELVKKENAHPASLSGVMYSDAWYLPGGQNYAAKLMGDAGYNYLWAHDSTEGFLSLSYETVLEKASQADYWLGVADYPSLKSLADASERYTYFKPFQTGKVYSYNKRIGAKGGSEFLELGYVRPDLILNDLAKIAYPDMLPNYELYFYFQLPKE